MFSLSSLVGDDASILGETNFQVLLVANLLGPLGMALLSPVLDSMIDPLGASPASIGLLISAFSAPSIVMIAVSGVLADRYGRKPIMLLSLVGYGATGAAIALTSTFTAALVLRFLQGLCYGGLTPIIITSIGDLYSGTEEATAQGLRFTSSGLSQTVFPLLAGLLVAVAWQAPFLIYALSFPVAVAVYIWFDEPTRTATVERTDDDRFGYIRDLLGLLGQRKLAAMVLARGLGTAVWVAFLTYNSIIVVRLLGGTPGQAGLLFAAASVALSVASSQAGRVTAAFDSRLWPLIGANACFLAGTVAVVFAPHLAVAVVGVVFVGAAFGLMLSLYRSIVTQLVPTSHRGGAVSAAESFGRVMDTLTPVVIGGALALGTATLGFQQALQLTLVGVVGVGTVVGSLALVVVRTAPPVEA